MLYALLLSALALAQTTCVPVNFCHARKDQTTEIGCFYSTSTKTPVNYAVTFPAGYSFQKNFAYAIFLHGRGGDEKQFSDLTAAIPPLLTIAPREPIHSYWKNGAGGKFQTAKMVAKDLQQHLEERLARKYGKVSKGIFGISMGGHGALFVADLYPNAFGKIYAISPLFRSSEELPSEDLPAFGRNKSFQQQDPVFRYRARIKKHEAGFRFGENFRIEIWRNDPFLQNTAHTKSFLEEVQRNSPGKVRLDLPGAHDGAYWNEALPRALQFFLEELKQPDGPSRECSA